jgi:hypothetical protein
MFGRYGTIKSLGTTALGQQCLDGMFICGPVKLTNFGTPLFLSTWDLPSGPRSDRICAEDLGAAVGLPWLGTEAPNHQQTVDIWFQILVGWGQMLQIVLVPSPIHWYVCWRGWGLSCIPVSPHGLVERILCVLKKEMFFAHFNRTIVVCVHAVYNVMFSPNTTLHQFEQQTLMPNWVKSFFDVNKAWEDFAFVLVCLSIKVYRVNTWSAIR